MSETSEERTVWVEVQSGRYPVFISPGGLAGLGARLAEHVPSHRVFVVTDANVGPLYADRACASLRSAGFKPTLFTVEPGEGSKTLAVAARLYDTMAEAGIDRACPALALGGGVVGDLTGFVAATWLRGVPFVQCPTTVEANVDASVGGKTAVNHSSGKNMIGAFYQPRFVLIDPTVLTTLSERDYRAGLAESIKHAAIRDADFFAWHEREAEAIRACRVERLVPLFERNVRIKAAIVAQDEREVTGLRALLNFGHTVGHAIETVTARRGDPWRHGEAVAVGMIAAGELSVAAGRLDRSSADRLAAVIERTGLPTTAPLAADRHELLTLMRADKKVVAGAPRLVLLDALGSAYLRGEIEPAWLQAALERVLR